MQFVTNGGKGVLAGYTTCSSRDYYSESPWQQCAAVQLHCFSPVKSEWN